MATNDELSDAVSESIETAANGGVVEYGIRGRKVVREKLKDLVDAKLKLDALASSKRGFSVGRITRPT